MFLDVYCKTWKLTVNCTKVLIFGGSKEDYKTIFKLGNMILETIEIYKYLGIIYHKSNKSNILFSQAQKSMYFTLK